MRWVALTDVSGLGPFRRLCEAAGDRVFPTTLRLAGVPGSLVETPHAMMPLSAMCDLFASGARQTGNAFFGFDVGEAMRPADFGVWVRYALAAGTLRRTIDRCARTLHYHQPGARFSLERTRNHLVWRFHPAAADPSGHWAHADHVLPPMLSAVRHFAGETWLPAAFHVPYPRPPHARQLQQRLRARVVYESPGVGLVLPEGLLDVPGPVQDKVAAAALGEMRRVIARRRSGSLSGTLESLITFGPERDGFDLPTIARLLSRSPRSLQKELEAEGTTFREILSRTRLAEARALIKETSLPLSEIAWRLGYSELPHFSRAFAKAAGMPPSAYRLARNGPDAAGRTNGVASRS